MHYKNLKNISYQVSMDNSCWVHVFESSLLSSRGLWYVEYSMKIIMKMPATDCLPKSDTKSIEWIAFPKDEKWSIDEDLFLVIRWQSIC